MEDKTYQYLCADVQRVLGWQHRTTGPGQESQGESGESTHMRGWRKQRVPSDRVSGDIGEGAPPMPQAASWLERCVSCQRENVTPLCFLHFSHRKTGRPSWEPCTVWPLTLTSPPSKSSNGCDQELG